MVSTTSDQSASPQVPIPTKIVIAGGFGAGKSTFVSSISEIEPLSTEAVISTYADSSGLDLEPLPWYIAFGSFKLAVIVEGIHYRHSLGKTVGEGFGGIGDLVRSQRSALRQLRSFSSRWRPAGQLPNHL